MPLLRRVAPLFLKHYKNKSANFEIDDDFNTDRVLALDK
jgi:hypothetical protein